MVRAAPPWGANNLPAVPMADRRILFYLVQDDGDHREPAKMPSG